MDLDVVLLSRIQFAFVITFHIIFPSFTIGLAAWLATIEGMSLATGNPIYRRVFDFWLKVFAVSFGMGVVSGIVMAFQFGTNWSVLAERTGSIQGPLLGYETFTAFLLEATFFGIVMFGRSRVPPWFYLVSCCMVALGTTASSFWILANNSWMQVPVGHAIVDGKIIPTDWLAIIWGPIFQIRWLHMLFAAYLTTAMCVAATGAWYLLRRVHLERRPRHAALGPGVGGPADPVSACSRAPQRQVHAEIPAVQVYRHRGRGGQTAATGPADPVRLARPGQRAQSVRDRHSQSGSFVDDGNFTAEEPGI